MSNQNEILNSEEVEFLLEASAAANGPKEKPNAAATQQPATMRGDLQQMPLADIFQTLGMAKMEGVLKVANPIEQRLVHFKDGLVKIVVPPRAATRRLGQRLVQAGVIEGEQLRLALLEQRKDPRPLGELLVAGGHVTAEQIDDIISMQVTEELFSLFTWEHGEFEFFKGKPQNEALLERLESCPEFEINSLLLEVARRSDEWESILASLRSLDEVPLPLGEGPAVDDLDESQRSVLVAIDGKHTYRELGDITVMSVFDCARACRDLMTRGLIGVGSDDHLLGIARGHLEQGNAKMALMLARTLCSREGLRPIGVVRDIAAILRQANELAAACEVLLEAAQLQSDANLAMELAKEAQAMNPRDLAAQNFLRTTMLAHLAPDSPEVETATLNLLDGLIADNDIVRALEICDETVQMECRTPSVMLRQARALLKKKDRDGAVAVFLEAAAEYERVGDKQRQIEALELAFRSDRDRKDLNKQLRALKSTPQTRAVKYGVIASVALLGLGLGAVWLSGKLHSDRALAAGTEISAMLAAADLKGAEAALERWAASLGECPELDDLRGQVRFAAANDAMRRQKEAMKAAADRLQQAGDLVLAGKLDAAFLIYDELRADEAVRKSAEDAAAARIDALLRDLAEAQKHVGSMLPSPPTDLTEQQQVEDTLTMLHRQVPLRLRDAAHEILRLRDGHGLPAEIPAEKRQELLTTAEKAVELLDRGAELTRLYEAASARNEQQRQLDPLFKSALESERKLDFANALVAYRQLTAAGAGSAQLRQHFATRVQQLEGIVGVTAAISAATAKGDFATANREYQALALAHPQIPFQQAVRLPLTVTTSMPGARVRYLGKDIGKSPILVSYAPGQQCEVEAALNRFQPIKTTAPYNHNGQLFLVLTLQPQRQLELPANIDQQLAMTSDGRLFAVDRAAAVLGIDLDRGKIAWRLPTNEASGFLSPPLLYRDLVLVGSLEGPLRALAQSDGKQVWAAADAHTEYAPAQLDGRIAVVGNTGTVWMLDPKNGAQIGTVSLPAEPRGDPVVCGNTLVVPLADNTVAAIDGKSHVISWRSEAAGLGQSLRAADNDLVAVRDDGQLSLVDAATGKTRWQRQLPGTPIGRPTVFARRSLLTFDDRVVCIDLQKGAEVWSTPRPDEGWLEPARFLGDLAVVPARNGSILVYGFDSPRPRYRLAGDRSVAIGGDGRERLVVTAGKLLFAYHNLP